MSRGILISRKQKTEFSKISLKNPSADNLLQFKKFRNLYNLVIRNAKKQYYEKQLEANKQNLRKTWKILFSSINKNTKKQNDISHLTINGRHVSEPKIMATKFNKFFTSIAQKTVANINPSNKDPTSLIPQNPNKFQFNVRNLTKSEILEATKLLANKKTPDHTGVSTYFIKQTLPSFIDPLFHIFKLSFKEGVVPAQLKIAKVVPIFKACDKSFMDNY